MFNLFKTVYSTEPTSQLNFDEFVDYVKNSPNEAVIQQLRDEYRKNGKTKDYQEKKCKFLPCIRPQLNTDIAFIDIDGVSDTETVKNRISKDKHVLFIQNSVSDNGLSILIKIKKTKPEHFATAYHKLAKRFVQVYKLPDYDHSCSNYNRNMFLSYDSNAYYNPNAASLDIPLTSNEISKISNDTSKISNDTSKKSLDISKNPLMFDTLDVTRAEKSNIKKFISHANRQFLFDKHKTQDVDGLRLNKFYFTSIFGFANTLGLSVKTTIDETVKFLKHKSETANKNRAKINFFHRTEDDLREICDEIYTQYKSQHGIYMVLPNDILYGIKGYDYKFQRYMAESFDVKNFKGLKNNIVSQTGSGKTFTMAEFKNNGKRNLILQPTLAMMKDFQNQYEGWLPYNGFDKNPDSQNIICSFASCEKLLKTGQKFDNIIIDEFHTLLDSAEYQPNTVNFIYDLIKNNPLNANLWTFTATPYDVLLKSLDVSSTNFIKEGVSTPVNYVQVVYNSNKKRDFVLQKLTECKEKNGKTIILMNDKNDKLTLIENLIKNLGLTVKRINADFRLKTTDEVIEDVVITTNVLKCGVSFNQEVDYVQYILWDGWQTTSNDVWQIASRFRTVKTCINIYDMQSANKKILANINTKIDVKSFFDELVESTQRVVDKFNTAEVDGSIVHLSLNKRLHPNVKIVVDSKLGEISYKVNMAHVLRETYRYIRSNENTFLGLKRKNMEFFGAKSKIINLDDKPITEISKEILEETKEILKANNADSGKFIHNIYKKVKYDIETDKQFKEILSKDIKNAEVKRAISLIKKVKTSLDISYEKSIEFLENHLIFAKNEPTVEIYQDAVKDKKFSNANSLLLSKRIEKWNLLNSDDSKLKLDEKFTKYFLNTLIKAYDNQTISNTDILAKYNSEIENIRAKWGESNFAKTTKLEFYELVSSLGYIWSAKQENFKKLVGFLETFMLMTPTKFRVPTKLNKVRGYAMKSIDFSIKSKDASEE